MASLLSGYTLLSLGVFGSIPLAQATLPVDPDGFMPFQDNYILWKTIGFSGLGLYQSRWLVQWLHSEKHKESRVPVAFWWLSIGGALLCLLYFLRQQDSVGVAGYVFSVVPYTRNLMLVYAQRRREAAMPRGFDVGESKQ